MNQPNEPGATPRAEAAVASLDAQMGTARTAPVPTPQEIAADVEATKLMVAKGYLGIDEGRFRLQADKLLNDLRKEQAGGNSAGGSGTGGAPSADVEALARMCEGKRELLRPLLSMLPDAQGTALLQRVKGKNAP